MTDQITNIDLEQYDKGDESPRYFAANLKLDPATLRRAARVIQHWKEIRTKDLDGKLEKLAGFP